MDILRRDVTGISILGEADYDYRNDNEAALRQAALLKESGFSLISCVVHVAGFEPIQALRNITNGPARVANGEIIGPYVANGQVMRGFALYRPPTESHSSIANILSRCVRISSNDLVENPKSWQALANVELRTVEPIPLLEPRLINPDQECLSTVDRVWSILANPYFRRGSRQALENYRGDMQKIISTAVASESPLQLILPTIPFKDQNPITTGQPIEEVDLGEHAMIAQLRDLVESIRQVYAPGLQIILVSDGQVYREIFTTANKEQVNTYSDNVQQLITRYGIEDSVSIVDFADIVAGDEGFETHKLGIEKLLLCHPGQRVVECLRSLQRGMLVNCQFDEYSMINIERYLKTDTTNWPMDIKLITANAARRYASFLLAASQRRILELEFPDAIRATVHPKDAPQLPLHLTNRKSMVFPYNGIPVVREDDYGLRKSLRIIRLSQLLSKDVDYYQCQDTQGRTLYYQRITNNEELNNE